jgi:hypothetical protein
VSALDLFDELAKHVLVHVASGAAGVGAPVLRDDVDKETTTAETIAPGRT